MNTRWRLKPSRSRADRSAEPGGRSLVARGPDPAEPRDRRPDPRAEALLEPSLPASRPRAPPGRAEAADRIVSAIRDERKIVIYGDYDVDGVCGTSILWTCLRLAARKMPPTTSLTGSTKVTASTPTHCGGSPPRCKADLVVTVDCGISAVAEAKLARELGLEFIVTDHHTPGTVPSRSRRRWSTRGQDDHAIRFPTSAARRSRSSSHGKFARAFGDGKKASPHLRDFLVRSIGLVALATVADMVPLTARTACSYDTAWPGSRPTRRWAYAL